MRWTLVVIFCAFQLNGFAGSMSMDSVGIEKKGDQSYIQHVVAEGETLYSVSRRYNVPIYKIIESNPPTEFGLEVGKIILIPIIKKEVKKVEIMKPQVDKPVVTANEIHIVEAKQTLFSISRMYGVTVADIKEWNNLSGNELEIGQRLVIKKGVTPSATMEESKPTVVTEDNDKIHVVSASETLYSISKLYEVSIDDIKKWNRLIGNEISIGQQLIVGKNIRTDTKSIDTSKVVVIKPEVSDKSSAIDTAKYNIKPETRTNFEETVESGLAEQIEGTTSSRKYLGMHRKAKVGTIMKVKNEMNDQEVFVRIIGKLPDTGVNKNVVIKISKAAYDRLGAIDPRFRVTISYIP
ncbi:MAG TPA: LysM peptidoglycan-binding domain-containing protein [Fulvivirga sp.]|nr:LysM peptidoglycan-binding domain-containing protein [Fulvivirga sp.]